MSLSIHTLWGSLVLLPFVFSAPADPTTADGDTPPRPPRYVGVKACKNCHKGRNKGEIHEKWSKGPHANAFKTLASAKAKEVATKLKIDDPQESAKCLKCHVTAYELDKKLKKRSLKAKDGVGCESCHGPGENHAKIRMKEAQKGGTPAPVTADEIKTLRDISTCKQCHNEKSPTHKPFCFKERMKQIQHLDPRKKRTAKEIEVMESKCYDDCKICAEKKEKDKAKGAKK